MPCRRPGQATPAGGHPSSPFLGRRLPWPNRLKRERNSMPPHDVTPPPMVVGQPAPSRVFPPPRLGDRAQPPGPPRAPGRSFFRKFLLVCGGSFSAAVAIGLLGLLASSAFRPDPVASLRALVASVKERGSEIRGSRDDLQRRQDRIPGFSICRDGGLGELPARPRTRNPATSRASAAHIGRGWPFKMAGGSSGRLARGVRTRSRHICVRTAIRCSMKRTL